MTFDELRSPWQESNRELASPEKREDLVARTCRRVERLEASFVRRDVIETIAAIAACFTFGRMFLRTDNLIARIGAGIVVIAAVYIVYKLHRTRMDGKQSHMDDSVRDYCTNEVERLHRQVHLLRSVVWWYVSPILVGVNLVFFGMNGVGIGSIAYFLFTLLLGLWIYRLNQKAVAKSLIPALDELSGLLEELRDTHE